MLIAFLSGLIFGFVGNFFKYGWVFLLFIFIICCVGISIMADNDPIVKQELFTSKGLFDIYSIVFSTCGVISGNILSNFIKNK